VNGRINAGPGAVWASFSKSQGGKSCSTANMVIGNAACGVQAKMTVVGYDYVMSKRTKMFAAYAKIDNGFNGRWARTTTTSPACGRRYCNRPRYAAGLQQART